MGVALVGEKSRTGKGRISSRFFGSTDNLNEEIRLLCENSSCLRCCLLADFRHQRFPLEEMAEGGHSKRDWKFCRNLHGQQGKVNTKQERKRKSQYGMVT